MTHPHSPVFPGKNFVTEQSLTKRELFALVFMFKNDAYSTLASKAVQLADQLMAELNKEKE